MLEEIVFSTKDNTQVEWHLKSNVGDYENNLKTSHVLEYELYKLYIKDRKYHLNIKEKCGKEILKELPIRRYIHNNFENECDVLTSGRNRSSLLGVQIFVMIKNYSEEYDVLRIRRSENVAIKPGFLQFIPSGGFEAMNDCVDYDAQWDNYSITKAVFRELLEECFGQDEDDKSTCGNNVSPDRIYYNDKISRLIKRINDTNDGTSMQLLGSTMSLVGLRHELSFILVIDDIEFGSSLIGNYESKSAIHRININLLENRIFWIDDDLDKLNCTSAGLFELARGSELYRKCLNIKNM